MSEESWGHAGAYKSREDAVNAAMRLRHDGKRVKIVKTYRDGANNPTYEVKATLPNPAEREHGQAYKGRRFRRGSSSHAFGDSYDSDSVAQYRARRGYRP